MASAQKCGGVHRNITTNSTTGAQVTSLRTAAQPTSTGTAPAAPPMTMFCVLVRFSHSVYTNT